jgi:hypothetical protein
MKLNNALTRYGSTYLRQHMYAMPIDLDWIKTVIGPMMMVNRQEAPERPILGQIDAHQLSDVLVATVRYYGGTKFRNPRIDCCIQSCKSACFR